METVQITHFSDTLCVWAYVTQVRCDELSATFGAGIEIRYRYMSVFGNVANKIDQWGDRGGLGAYAEHVRSVVGDFDQVSLHDDTWRQVVPTSSLPSHLFLCAVRLLEERQELPAGAEARCGWAVRRAFFADRADVSRRDVLLSIAERDGLPVDALSACLESGEAHASLTADFELARDQVIRASPTLVFNEGRQRLTGNVGYRIIEANVREFIDGRSVGEHSWC